MTISSVNAGIQDSGFSQIVAYFAQPGCHTDEDKKHISKDEFRDAIGKISPEADAFLNVIVNSKDGYTHLMAIQNEGWRGFKNDTEVSLRDLYAARRGTGYNGDEINKELRDLRLDFVYAGVTLAPVFFNCEGTYYWRYTPGLLENIVAVENKSLLGKRAVSMIIGGVSQTLAGMEVTGQVVDHTSCSSVGEGERVSNNGTFGIKFYLLDSTEYTDDITLKLTLHDHQNNILPDIKCRIEIY